MSEMRHAARQLAAQGRFGDSMLIHVSPAEVEGIASLIPGGLTTNPKTGLPEAFFFLPFLASLFGAAAPAAAAATAAAPALAGAAGAAAAGAGALGAGAAGTLGTIGALGAPSAAMTAGTLAAAAPAAVAAPAAATLAGSGGVGTLLGGVGTDAMIGGAPLAATAPAATGTGIASTLPATMNILPTSAQVGLQGAKGVGSALANPAGQSFAGAGTATAGPAAAVTPVAPATSVAPVATPTFTPGVTDPKTGIGGLFEKMGGWKSMPLWLTGASALSNAVGGLFQKKEKGEKKRDISKLKYNNSASSGGPTFPGDDYRPGYSGEHNYFPNYQYANGGIVTLADGGMVDPQMQQPQDMAFPLNGVPGTDEAPMLEDIPSSPYPSAQIGSEPEPPAGEAVEPTTNNDRELIAQTVEAIKGEVADPGPILLAFVQEFGEPALQDLAQRVKSMPPAGGPAGGPPMPGMNDGQSDSIPALIDGQQPAALSEGEFVVPADAVSGLGNGSTDAGAQQLQGMVDGVRQMRTGGAVQPPAINPQQVMPFAEGGLVSLFKKGGKVELPDYVAVPPSRPAPLYGIAPPRVSPMYMAPPRPQGGMYMTPPQPQGGMYVTPPQTMVAPIVRTQADKRSEAFWDGYDPGEQTGFAGNYQEWVVPSGTEPRSPRMPMIYRDWAMPMTVDPERGQSEEWVKNIKAYQKARQDLSMDAQGLPTSYGKNAKRK